MKLEKKTGRGQYKMGVSNKKMGVVIYVTKRRDKVCVVSLNPGAKLIFILYNLHTLEK